MSAIPRWNRGVQVDRAGGLPEELSPVRDLQLEQPIDPVQRIQRRFQDGFDTADKLFQDGFDAAIKRPKLQLNPIENLLTSAEFKERLQETLAGTSPRAQQVKQVESTYEAFWKDSQDFSVAKGPSLTVPEPPPRYEAPAETAWKGRGMTLPEFRVSMEDLPESVSNVQQAAQATTAQAAAAVLESRRMVAAVTEQPFSLLGRVALRG